MQRLGYKFPIRQSILPLVRWETPYLAALQVLPTHILSQSAWLNHMFRPPYDRQCWTYSLLTLPIWGKFALFLD